MPRPGPRRPLVSFKLDQSAIDWIDRLASERGENRSETMRAMLAYARKRMPRTWRHLTAWEEANMNYSPTPSPTLRADEPFPCQLGHPRGEVVMVTDSTYRQHVKRAHRTEARELGWLK